MIFLKRLKSLFFSAAVIASLLLSNTTHANTIHTTNTTVDTIELTNISSVEMEYNFYEGIIDKDGKGKAKWKAFWKGFAEGFTGEYDDLSTNPGSGSNTGLTESQLNEVRNFTSGEIQTSDNFLDLLYDMNDLMLKDLTTIPTRDQLLPIFKDNEQVVSTVLIAFNDISDDSPAGEVGDGWRKFGRVMGIGAKIVLIGLCC